ncbi:MAG: sterol-binding protein [Gammaproteobacteria bacterium]|nr:MAG: sterol-binding protein [Gammaproteobacteria bacterium]
MQKTLGLLAGVALMPSAWAGTYLDADWAKQACDAWNKSETLTQELGGDNWAGNNGGRGYKIIRLYREKCGPGSAVQLTISQQDGKAICTYGGKPTDEKLNDDMDYLMWATYDDWQCMGRGDWGCGAMGAMMTGKLNFQGPKGEAMGVMGPFNAFLQMMDDIPGDASQCPN